MKKRSKRTIPYGYRIQDGKLMTCQEEALVVRQIVSQYLQGLSYRQIANLLNQNQVPYSADAQWDKHKVKRMLENPRYIGADGYPIILDSQQFDAIQQKIREKTSCARTQPNREAVQIAKRAPEEYGYQISQEAIRLANEINRNLEQPTDSQSVIALIFSGVSARYDCCGKK